MAYEYPLTEHFVRKLMQISLQFDLGDYQKQLSFEKMLIFYCERGHVKAASVTLESAKSLNISIGADAMSKFLELNSEIGKSAGIWSQIVDLFKK